jgi:hypothetical protein
MGEKLSMTETNKTRLVRSNVATEVWIFPETTQTSDIPIGLELFSISDDPLQSLDDANLNTLRQKSDVVYSNVACAIIIPRNVIVGKSITLKCMYCNFGKHSYISIF